MFIRWLFLELANSVQSGSSQYKVVCYTAYMDKTMDLLCFVNKILHAEVIKAVK